MDAMEALKFYESCWFELEILKSKPKSGNSSIFSSFPEEGFQERKISRLPTAERSLSSAQLSSTTSFTLDSLSTNTVPAMPKLHTILSGKEATGEENSQEEQQQGGGELPVKRESRRRVKRKSKSLSQLEFEELKGFIDLGFVFSEEDKDSSLASIIPGLRNLNTKDGGDNLGSENSAIQRPYLSESWEIQIFDKREKENPLVNWRIPSLDDEADMKDSLKWWARTVASRVR